MQTQKIIPLTPIQAVPGTMPGLPASRPKNAPSSFHVMGKPSGATCNLDCSYCFFLSKEKLYPNSRFRISDETLEIYIRQMIESQRAPEITMVKTHRVKIYPQNYPLWGIAFAPIFDYTDS